MTDGLQDANTIIQMAGLGAIGLLFNSIRRSVERLEKSHNELAIQLAVLPCRRTVEQQHKDKKAKSICEGHVYLQD